MFSAKKYLITTILLILLIISTGFSQGRPYLGPEDPAGDIAAIRSGYMNGNRVILYFENGTKLGEWGSGKPLDSKWPNSYTGTRMIDNIALLIGSEVYIHQDSIPVVDIGQVAALRDAGEIDTLFYVQTQFNTGKIDLNYEKTIGWQFNPVPGYFNETQDYLALSNKEDSWPPNGWPSTGFQRKWNGEWNGRFGRGIKYADLESYFVANDAQDLEYIVQRDDPEQKLITEGPRYFPRPGNLIGDINPNVTVQKGYPWGGLGLRVSVRGFQWNNPEARDMVFWEYEISNISDYDLPTCGFGYYLDLRVGGEDADIGYYNTKLDLAYSWDADGIGSGGLTPGVFGMAYLESPGKPYDGVDNDEDGLLDEKRDNPAGEIIGPYDGITNLDDFLAFYHLRESELHDHFEGDEDQDWQDGVDANENGTYSYQDDLGDWYLEPGELVGDDVGLDGVGPMDLNYNGPDEGECNHRPDFVEGVGCEPNFAALDVSEADMLGLTSFHSFDFFQWSNYNWVPIHDKEMWQLIHDGKFIEFGGSAATLYFVFASTSFPFYKGRTERISMAMLHAYANMAGLQSATHSAPTLFRSKETAQVIYERDYRFAQPPLMPTLAATAGDSKVILTWDDRADKLTREPYLQNINDFEGYKIYRATDKLMSDPEVITDGQGTTMFKSPIFQCDLIDSVRGYADFGAVEGKLYYLGDDTGLIHYFVDENVQNGKTYYYAIVAYDFGVRDVGSGISPTENNIVIELDEAEEIIRLGTNVAVVTPHQKAAGYVDPIAILDEANKTWGSGYVLPEVIDREAIKTNHTYKVTFQVDTIDYKKPERLRHFADGYFINTGMSVYDISEGNKLVYKEVPGDFPLDNIILSRIGRLGIKKILNTRRELITDHFDGIQLKYGIPVVAAEVDTLNTGWLAGSSPVNVIVHPDAQKYYPWQYEIIFTDRPDAYQTKITKTNSIYHSDGKTGVPKSQVL